MSDAPALGVLEREKGDGPTRKEVLRRTSAVVQGMTEGGHDRGLRIGGLEHRNPRRVPQARLTPVGCRHQPSAMLLPLLGDQRGRPPLLAKGGGRAGFEADTCRGAGLDERTPQFVRENEMRQRHVVIGPCIEAEEGLVRQQPRPAVGDDHLRDRLRARLDLLPDAEVLEKAPHVRRDRKGTKAAVPKAARGAGQSRIAQHDAPGPSHGALQAERRRGARDAGTDHDHIPNRSDFAHSVHGLATTANDAGRARGGQPVEERRTVRPARTSSIRRKALLMPTTDEADAAPNSANTISVATTRSIALEGAATRREHDLLGESEIPAEAYWGIHTKRAVENFPITGVPVGHFPELIRALTLVKQAAARANARLGFLPAEKAASHRQGLRSRRQGAAVSTANSWSTRSRAAPARRPT